MTVITADGSIYGQGGRVLHFSIQQFVRDVIEGGCCFMCGRAESASVPFNSEHVVPQWILRRFSMYDQSITLPNRTTVRYGSYTVPCCEDCNQALGRTIETPVREALVDGFDSFADRMTPELGKLLFCWMSLIFLKTHLRDLQHRWQRDQRANAPRIGEMYDWRDMHHIQCMAHAPLVDAELTPTAAGTVIAMRATAGEFSRRYDYADFTQARTGMVQVEDTIVFAVLNDSRMCEVVTRPLISRLGRLSPVQSREVLVNLACANMRLPNRPRYRTELGSLGKLRVTADVPERLDVQEMDQTVFGAMLDYATQDFPFPGDREDLRQGRWTFLFNDRGEFLTDSIHWVVDHDPAPTDVAAPSNSLPVKA